MTYNDDTNLLCVCLTNAEETCGTDLIKMTISQNRMLSHCKS